VDDGAYPVKVNNTWKQFIIPVPNKDANVTITTAFIMRTRLDRNEYILVDDIRFITTGVTNNTNIVMDTTPLTINRTIDSGDSLPTIVRGTVANATVQRKYTTDGVGDVLLVLKDVQWFANNYAPAAWGFTTGITYTVEGDATLAGDTITLNNSANITEDTTRTFTIKASADGGAREASRTVTVNIKIDDGTEVKIIEDFSKAGEHSNGGTGNLYNFTNATYGYWVNDIETDYNVSTMSNTAPDGSRSQWFVTAHPDYAGCGVGRVLPAPVNISGKGDIIIDFRSGNTTDVYALVLYSGVTYKSGGGKNQNGEPNTDGIASIKEAVDFSSPGSAWTTITIPVSSFTTVNKAAINGWAILVKTKDPTVDTGGAATKFHVNFIGAE